jgi:tetratricopeptide (TPR) repeat protein
MLMDYLEGISEADIRHIIRDRLEKDPSLRRQLEDLQQEAQALTALGAALRAQSPTVQLQETLSAVLFPCEEDTEDLEQELKDLGESLRIQAPRLHLADELELRIAQEEHGTDRTPLEDTLIDLGHTLRNHTPDAALLTAIQERVHDTAQQQTAKLYILPKSEKTASARRRTKPSWNWRSAMAASFVLTIALFSILVFQSKSGHHRELALHKPDSTTVPASARSASSTEPSLQEEEHRPTGTRRTDELHQLFAVARPVLKDARLAAAAEEENSTPGFTIEDVLQAKETALAGQADALSMLARWGALDPAVARRLFDEGHLTAAQITGMSRFLPEGEAVHMLREALKQDPDDAALRFALASLLVNDPDVYDEAQQQLNTLRALAPDNALVGYMDARLRFAKGDFAGALEGIEFASRMEQAGAFGLDNARYHSAALQAAGLSSDLADTVAAFYGGTDEYGLITQMKSDLLGYGQYYQSLGEYDTAMMIYKSVGELGTQLMEGAAYTNEYLAGLDTQAAALDAMDVLANYIDIPGGLEVLQTTYNAFVESLNIFLDYTHLLENLTHFKDIHNVLNVVNVILQTGDISYLQQVAP